MPDLHQKRLRHLLANAILDLWKKETGSVTSVLIEGTICITSGNGKTTVIQIGDRFVGGIPDLPGNSSSPNDSSGFYDFTHGISGDSDVTENQLPSNNILNHPSPQVYSSRNSFNFLPNRQSTPIFRRSISLTTPSESLASLGKRKLTKGDDNPDNGSQQTEKIKSIRKSMDKPTTGCLEQSAGPVCPGTGYYTCSRSEGSKKVPATHTAGSESDISDDSDFEEMTSFEHGSPNPAGSLTNEKKHLNNEEKARPEVKSEELTTDPKIIADDSGLALDLSRKDTDLALSSPCSYTEQVRDVIRQRLLRNSADRASSESPSADLDSKSDVATPPPSFSSSMFSQHRRSFSHSWPGAVREKSSPSFYQPGTPHHSSLTSPLTIGLPTPPLLMSHSSMSPSMVFPFPSPLRDVIKPPTMTSPSSSPDENHMPSAPPSNQASPSALTDVNGNMEKDLGEQKIYKCEFCNKTFLFKSKYHEHLPVHTNARPFQCHMCSRTYKYKYDLRVHLRTHLGIPTKSTICPFCSAKFSTNKVLRVHIQDAHRDRQRSSDDDINNMTNVELSQPV